MEPELTSQAGKLIYEAIPILILFAGGIIVSTMLQEWVRARWRNGSGDRRNDANWSTQLLSLLRDNGEKLDKMNTNLESSIEMTREEFKDIRERLRNLK